MEETLLPMHGLCRECLLNVHVEHIHTMYNVIECFIRMTLLHIYKAIHTICHEWQSFTHREGAGGLMICCTTCFMRIEFMTSYTYTPKRQRHKSRFCWFFDVSTGNTFWRHMGELIYPIVRWWEREINYNPRITISICYDSGQFLPGVPPSISLAQ